MDLKHNISFCCTICFNPFKTLSKRHLLFRQEFKINNRIITPSAQFSTYLHCPTKYCTLLIEYNTQVVEIVQVGSCSMLKIVKSYYARFSKRFIAICTTYFPYSSHHGLIIDMKQAWIKIVFSKSTIPKAERRGNCIPLNFVLLGEFDDNSYQLNSYKWVFFMQNRTS